MKNQTFIFVHDQKIITDFISNKKFENLDNMLYVFLGEGDIDQIENLENVIISRNFEKNIEKWNKTLIAYTGWYLLWKNNLIQSEYVNLFEYDIVVKNDTQSIIYDCIEKNPEVNSISYIPLSIDDYWFLGDDRTSVTLLNSIEKNYKINGREFIKNYSPDIKVGLTSNQTLKKETFNSFMEWMEPIVEDIKEDKMAGHYPERALPFYILLNNLNKIILEEVLYHFQLDSHNTQGMYEQRKSNYKNILK